MSRPDSIAPIIVRDLSMAYGSRLIQQGLNFEIQRGEIFVIMGGSGCGKSTLLRHLIGLQAPAKGQVLIQGQDFWAGDEASRRLLQRRFGVLFQSGALWSSMTLNENVSLIIEQHCPELKPAEIAELAAFKLALVGLRGFDDYYPSEISGGMKKRAGLARALAVDPQILFIDEPSAGLDPISSKNLDELILALRDSLGATVVMVTHELPSIFGIADRAVFLDAKTKTQLALGAPRELLAHGGPQLREFLSRGETEMEASKA
ncbi:phospholipid/cholesterol/gamma-HCH transport system ATP-binding protein [Paucibacter oligotrophus]|uniref:Phospholipid/cholesterol/gamma-HCH transport system ATP-binding protein n=1 Tax=Roseateles oligotrophus TaxID=1769250 RepID=A0A840LEY1_9BURK|nr:ATP-binding cassette domain-containing protein [Roseateles oligotrophus]MBB4846251.1 phospholipid/cholesterol/gamma-HCH transport system ATP-binding protein [Roseateles oligotrophus]